MRKLGSGRLNDLNKLVGQSLNTWTQDSWFCPALLVLCHLSCQHALYSLHLLFFQRMIIFPLISFPYYFVPTGISFLIWNHMVLIDREAAKAKKFQFSVFVFFFFLMTEENFSRDFIKSTFSQNGMLTSWLIYNLWSRGKETDYFNKHSATKHPNARPCCHCPEWCECFFWNVCLSKFVSCIR